MDDNWDKSEAEKQIKQMKQQLEAYAVKTEALEKKCESLTDKLNAVSPPKMQKIEHSNDFWTEIDNNCSKKTGPYGSDAIKTMIKTGKMTIYDTDNWGQTLLHIAATRGAHDLAKFLINNVWNIYCT